MKGILGRKIGMTQVFTKEGKLVPVTVVEVEPNVVTQIKTKEKDGYDAIQLGAFTKKEKNTSRALVGHAKKAGTEPKRFYREIRGVNVNDYTLGQVVDASLFEAGEMVDIQGVSKGKGYAGPIKRWNQTRGPMGHGSQYHRGVGSLGTRLPMHVLKGKKMAGHMGAELVTVQNEEIVSVDLENNVILVKGNVPGPKKGLVLIHTAVKNPDVKNEIELLVYGDEEVKEEAVEETAEEVVAEAEEVTEEAPVEEQKAEEPVEESKE